MNVEPNRDENLLMLMHIKLNLYKTANLVGLSFKNWSFLCSTSFLYISDWRTMSQCLK